MTDDEITSIRLSKGNRNWLQDLKRRWNKGSLNDVLDHLKHYYELSDTDSELIMRSLNEQ